MECLMTKPAETDWLNSHKKPRTLGELREAFSQLRDCLIRGKKDETVFSRESDWVPDENMHPQLFELLLKSIGNRPETETSPLPWLESLYPPRGENGVPTGSILYVCGETPPDGYLVADGSIVLRASYPALFEAIGTLYGTSDNGMTTFRLPDLRGEFIRCVDFGRGLDAGRALGSVQGDQIRNHNHGFLDLPKMQFGSGVYSWTPQVMEIAEHEPITTTWTGGVETRPRNIALLACIRY